MNDISQIKVYTWIIRSCNVYIDMCSFSECHLKGRDSNVKVKCSIFKSCYI